MWSLVYINAKNIASFRELEYEIRRGITTLVFGQNLDNDSQGSNGSGKSALLEAIAIAFTGEPLRDIRTEEIINDEFEESVVLACFENSMTKETFSVERTLSRKKAQKIECFLYDANGEQIKEDETVQSGVSEYNKYILDKIGLSKDDLFSNFILSKHKCQCFLSSPDKNKKEMINRLSNAIIIDEAIEAMSEDIESARTLVNNAQNNVSNIEGKICAIEMQIETEKECELSKKDALTKRKQELSESINSAKSKISSIRASIREKNEYLRSLDKLYNSVLEIDEDEKTPNNKRFEQVKNKFKEHIDFDFNYWDNKVESLNNRIKEANSKSNDLQVTYNDLQKKCDISYDEFDKYKKECSKIESTHVRTSTQLEQKTKEVEDTLAKTKDGIANLSKEQLSTVEKIRNLENKIAGSIECPKCKHVFVLDLTIDVESAKKNILELESGYEDLCNQIECLRASEGALLSQKKIIQSKISDLSDELAKRKSDLLKKEYHAKELGSFAQEALRKLQSVNEQINEINELLENLSNESFDYAFNLIESFTNSAEKDIECYEREIISNESAIQTYNEAIKETESISSESLIKHLSKTLKELNGQLNVAKKEVFDLTAELNKLLEQVSHFTNFKTHLANSKIDALAQITNEFLEKIGSDIRIKFDGYTVLKSGKIRDKISTSLVRDGVDCGSFGKFSEGEKARVNLANILAIHKLTNMNCEDGKGLDLLVLDEILDATDETGLSNVFQALNTLHITSLVVSHGNIAENYKHKLIITKKNKVSFINED